DPAEDNDRRPGRSAAARRADRAPDRRHARRLRPGQRYRHPARRSLLRPAYTVQSRQSTVDVNLLGAADVPSGRSVARFLGLGPGTPPTSMSDLAQQIGGNVAGGYQRALALEDFLGTHYTLVNDAPSGHAYPNLNFFLFSPPSLGGQKGTSEQFAASFAVLARMLGLPSRVIVGFQGRPGVSTVHGRDALAWPGVLFSDVGW